MGKIVSRRAVAAVDFLILHPNVRAHYDVASRDRCGAMKSHSFVKPSFANSSLPDGRRSLSTICERTMCLKLREDTGAALIHERVDVDDYC